MHRVLVAENSCNPIKIAYTLKTYFQTDCIVYAVSHIQDVFHYLSRIHFDIIFLDMEMPGSSNRDLLQFLQNTDHLILLPMVNLETFDPAKFSNSNSISDYLIKPFSETELILTMEEALQNCRQKDTITDSMPFISRSESSRANLFKSRLEQYIKEHYHDIFSMQEVAHAMNYSDTHFCRLFKQCFHVNFSVYLNEYRVEQAKKLLVSSDIAVKEVSTSCGYRDTSYFIRVFKRHTGTTPNDYRIQKMTMSAKKSDKSQNNFIS